MDEGLTHTDAYSDAAYQTCIEQPVSWKGAAKLAGTLKQNQKQNKQEKQKKSVLAPWSVEQAESKIERQRTNTLNLNLNLISQLTLTLSLTLTLHTYYNP